MSLENERNLTRYDCSPRKPPGIMRVAPAAAAALPAFLLVLLIGVLGVCPARAQDGGVTVVNAASFDPAARVASGSLATAFGDFEGVQITVAGATPLPSELGGVRVLVAGNNVPLLFVSATQINFQVPSELVLGSHEIVVVWGEAQHAAGSIEIIATGPGLFVLDPADPLQPGLVMHQDFTVNGPKNPAPLGSSLSLFGTGQGPLGGSIPDGVPAPNAPLLKATAGTEVLVAGEAAPVLFTGLAPGFVGLWQVNFTLPPNVVAGPGGAISVLVRQGGVPSNSVTIWVEEDRGEEDRGEEDRGEEDRGEEDRGEGVVTDRDGDLIPDSVDNCVAVVNPLQVDLDLDKVGDVCDNCPTQPNPGQEDGNKDGGGDACEAPVEVSHCGDPFVPELGVASALRDFRLPHPELNGVVHPVVQFTMTPMELQRRQLAALDFQLQSPFSPNLFFAAVNQASLDDLAALPFVRSVFPLPTGCREGPDVSCPQLTHGRWNALRTTRDSPRPRDRLAMAYDSTRRVTVLFGGLGSAAFDDTWLWNGEIWTQVGPKFPASPPARSQHTMAFDEARGATLLFGGLDQAGDVLGDTWIWDGSNWTRLAPKDSPSPRRAHAMAFDEARGVVLLFGGLNRDGKVLGDTWAWDGALWKELAPADSPTPRAEHGMAYDAGRTEVVLYGGVATDGQPLQDNAGHTWVWDGSNWSDKETVNHPADSRHAMATQSPACGVVLSGGLRAAARAASSETWFWSGDDWIQTNANPDHSARSGHGLAYDSARRRTVLFGGIAGRALLPSVTSELEPSHIREISFHEEIPPAIAASILASHDAIVLQPGVTVGSVRVNVWHAAVPDSETSALALEDPVSHVQFVSQGQDGNDGGRAAIGVNVAQGAPWCGAGCSGNNVVFAQWESRWASGDATPPPPPAALPGGLGTHPGLTNRVTVRDLTPLNPVGPVPPVGCAGAIVCNLCTFSNHAVHVAGTMLGSGANNLNMIGMSPNATSVSYNAPASVVEQTCELQDSNQGFGARAANNSFGNGFNNGTMGLYDLFSQGNDQQIRAVPAEVVVWSAGNSQRSRGAALALPSIYSAPSTGGTCTAPPPGVPAPAQAEPAALVRRRFYTILPGRGQSAKNTVVVGAINSGAPSVPGTLGRMTTFSSWGPTRDGRIKPDMVAAGAENNIVDSNFDPGDPGITSAVCTLGGTCVSISNVPANQYGALSGTSMAAPAVTGGIGLLMEHQAASGLAISDVALDSDSTKALLIHTATDLQAHFPPGGAFMNLGTCGGVANACWPVPPVVAGVVRDGPDFVNGWGLVNIPAALQKITDRNPQVTLQPSGCPNNVTFAQLPFNSPLAIGGNPTSIGIAGCSATAIWDWVGYIEVPAGTTQLKVTIAWDDAQTAAIPAATSTAGILVNDLDLIVTPGTGMGGSFTPTEPHNYSWWLDPACPYRQAAQVTANDFDPATYADHRNNVEQVIVTNPAASQWRIVVQSLGIASTGVQQPFAIVISMQ